MRYRVLCLALLSCLLFAFAASAQAPAGPPAPRTAAQEIFSTPPLATISTMPAPAPVLGALDPLSTASWMTSPAVCNFRLERCQQHCGGEVDCSDHCNCAYWLCIGEPLPNGC